MKGLINLGSAKDKLNQKQEENMLRDYMNSIVQHKTEAQASMHQKHTASILAEDEEQPESLTKMVQISQNFLSQARYILLFKERKEQNDADKAI